MDKLGRLTLPKSMRNALKITENTSVIVEFKNSKIIIKKVETGDSSVEKILKIINAELSQKEKIELKNKIINRKD